MSDEHARFEQLAVGHVLGGLPEQDATEFRGHLTTCRDCRSRVAELRDIAADLAAAEREERQQARLKTEVLEREAGQEPPDTRSWPVRSLGPRAVALATATVFVLAAGLAAWSFHLRTVNAELLAVAERQGVVMQTFADGTPVAARLSEGVAGRVAVTDDRVAVTLVDVPRAATDRRLVIWLVAADDARAVYVGTGAGADGRLAWAGERDGADRLLVTLEPWPPTSDATDPTGTVLVDADLLATQAERVRDGAEPRPPFLPD